MPDPFAFRLAMAFNLLLWVLIILAVRSLI